MTIAEIIARLENATGPSIELDEEIRLAVGAESINYGSAEGLVSTDECCGPPEYTSSLDVALTLMPDGWNIKLERFADGDLWQCFISRYVDHQKEYYASWDAKFVAYPPAIALTIAALRAREATERAG